MSNHYGSIILYIKKTDSCLIYSSVMNVLIHLTTFQPCFCSTLPVSPPHLSTPFCLSTHLSFHPSISHVSVLYWLSIISHHFTISTKTIFRSFLIFSIDRSTYIIKDKLETSSSMESYLPTSDRHAASWIFSDGPSKPLGVVKLRYNALKLFFYNVAILRQRACFRQI